MVLPLSAMAALLLASSGALDMNKVEQAATLMAQGKTPYALDGTEKPEKSENGDYSLLKGCVPNLSRESDQKLVILDYVCSRDSEPYSHRVWFTAGKNQLTKIEIDPKTSAVGPTNSALASDNLPSPSRQFRKFLSAIKKQGDLTSDGTIPLNTQQIERLAGFADCDWLSEGRSSHNGLVHFAYVSCPEHGPKRGRFVNVEFDASDRVRAVRIEHGGAVRR